LEIGFFNHFPENGRILVHIDNNSAPSPRRCASSAQHRAELILDFLLGEGAKVAMRYGTLAI
jgi:hypothetical protein